MSRSLQKCATPGCPIGATGEDARHCAAHQGERSAFIPGARPDGGGLYASDISTREGWEARARRAEELNALVAADISTREEEEEEGEAPSLALIEQDSAKRKMMPMARGLFDYFPAALAEVAHISFIGNEKHNPGEPLHWSRGKSDDHADCIARHLVERGGGEWVHINGQRYYHRHSAALAWRALALLQLELEAEGKVAEARTPRGA